MKTVRWRTWLGRFVTQSWRRFLTTIPDPSSLTHRNGRRTVTGTLSDGVAYRIHSPAPPDRSEVQPEVAQLLAQAEARFEQGQFFTPLHQAVSRGAVVTAHVVQGNEQERHHLIVLHPLNTSSCAP